MIENLPNEFWIPVKEYEEYYCLSNKGRFKALERTWLSGKNGVIVRHKPETLLKTKNDKDGYKLIVLTKNGKPKTFKVHRLIAIQLIPNPYNKSQVNHINGVKWDNVLENLEWANSSENQLHAYKLGLSKVKTGEKHSQCKISDEQVKEIRRLYDTGSYTQLEIAKMFSIHREYCACIIRKKNRV